MFGLRIFWKRLSRQLLLKWDTSEAILKIITIILSLIVFGVFVSYAINPDWFSNYQSFLNLLGTALLVVISLVSGFIQTFTQVFSDYRASQKTYRAFERITNNSKRVLCPKLKGIPFFIAREETQIILDHICNSHAVILTGEAGAGKSGIAIDIIAKSEAQNKFCLLIDSKSLAHVQDAGDLRAYFDIEESFYEALRRLGGFVQAVVVVDQIDNIAGTPACNVVIELLTTCASFDGISVVAVSRHREANEQGAIRPLLETGFINVSCQLITNQLVIDILKQVGIDEVSPALLELANNLLNLDLICEIVRTYGTRNLSNIENIIGLWERYRLMLRDKENFAGHRGDDFIAEAVRLSRIGLAAVDRSFEIDYPPTQVQTRLKSGNIITQISGRKYQFRHEKLQDYLYAWDACERNHFVQSVYEEIGRLHSRNVILLMRDIYEASDAPEVAEQFLEGILDG